MEFNTPLIRPVRSPHRVTSPYGWRTLAGNRQFHDGIDYVSTVSDEVLAIADGRVLLDFDYYDHSKAWTDNRHSAGNYLILAHEIDGRSYYCRYIHLISNTVEKGDRVSQGTIIGHYADVGRSYGAHLHFDMYDSDWNKLDPTQILLRGFEVARGVS